MRYSYYANQPSLSHVCVEGIFLTDDCLNVLSTIDVSYNGTKMIVSSECLVRLPTFARNICSIIWD